MPVARQARLGATAGARCGDRQFPLEREAEVQDHALFEQPSPKRNALGNLERAAGGLRLAGSQLAGPERGLAARGKVEEARAQCRQGRPVKLLGTNIGPVINGPITRRPRSSSASIAQ